MSCKRATFIRHISRNNHLGQNYFNKYVNDNFQRRKKFDFNLGDHRNYHSSREPRSTIVKLTPQEVRI